MLAPSRRPASEALAANLQSMPSPRDGRTYLLKEGQPSKDHVPKKVTAESVAESGTAPFRPTTGPKLRTATASSGSPGVKADIRYLGMDVDAERQVVVVQVDATTPKPAHGREGRG